MMTGMIYDLVVCVCVSGFHVICNPWTYEIAMIARRGGGVKWEGEGTTIDNPFLASGCYSLESLMCRTMIR